MGFLADESGPLAPSCGRWLACEGALVHIAGAWTGAFRQACYHKVDVYLKAALIFVSRRFI
jgi:hypothetical protein